MIPFTREELRQLVEVREMLAHKGMNFVVTVIDLMLKFAVVAPDEQTAGDDQTPTGTTQSE